MLAIVLTNDYKISTMSNYEVSYHQCWRWSLAKTPREVANDDYGELRA
jgi:hypothetical protein